LIRTKVRFALKINNMKTAGKTHEGKVALVTGAAQGIGQAIAVALAERGAQVIATDMLVPQETLNKIGPAASGYKLDVSQEDDWQSLALETEALGGVDIVVNNAGYFPNRPIEQLDLAKNDRNEPGLPLFEREGFFAGYEKKEMGALHRHILQYGGPVDSRHEPLYHV